MNSSYQTLPSMAQSSSRATSLRLARLHSLPPSRTRAADKLLKNFKKPIRKIKFFQKFTSKLPNFFAEERNFGLIRQNFTKKKKTRKIYFETSEIFSRNFAKFKTLGRIRQNFTKKTPRKYEFFFDKF